MIDKAVKGGLNGIEGLFSFLVVERIQNGTCYQNTASAKIKVICLLQSAVCSSGRSREIDLTEMLQTRQKTHDLSSFGLSLDGGLSLRCSWATLVLFCGLLGSSIWARNNAEETVG